MELNKVYNMDCMEGMEMLENDSVDLIITSPPYNLGGKFHTGSTYYKAYDKYSDKIPEEIYQKEQIEFLNKCYDKLKEGGSMFYNHKPRIKEGVCIHPLQWILQSKFILKQEIVWKNRSQNFDKIRFYPMSERIYWLVKNPKTKLFNEVGKSDVWEDIKNQKRHKDHKATFPIELPRTIMKCFKDANIIMDPYNGVGTTFLACLMENRKYIGFEISEEYCKITNKRIEEYKKEIEEELQC